MEKEKKKCDCGPNCTCGCQEGMECTCNGECKCGPECTCGCKENKECECKEKGTAEK